MAVYRIPVNVTWTGPGSPGVNVFHAESAISPADPAGLQSIVNSINAFYATLCSATGGQVFASGTSFTLGQVIDVDTQVAQTISWTTQTQANSGQADLPPTSQICVTWRTAVAARRARGRSFLGPLAVSAANSDGGIGSGVRTKVLGAATALVGASTSATNTSFVVRGLVAAGTGPNGPRRGYLITGAAVGDQFAVLRSRRN